MVLRIPKTLIKFLLLLSSISSSLASRNFNLVFDSIKCAPNNEYVEAHSCSFGKTEELIPFLSVDVQMRKEIQEARIDFVIFTKFPNKEVSTLFKADGIKFCEIVQEKISAMPFLKILYDMMRRAGTIPDSCPISADYHFVFPNLTMNLDYMPSYAPKVSFESIFVANDRKSSVISVTVKGRIVPFKSKNKSKRHY